MSLLLSLQIIFILHCKSSVVAEHYHFGCRRQEDLKTIADFMADLCKVAVKYNFKKAALDETLRDKFVVDFVKNSLGTGYSDDLAFDQKHL